MDNLPPTEAGGPKLHFKQPPGRSRIGFHDVEYANCRLVVCHSAPRLACTASHALRPTDDANDALDRLSRVASGIQQPDGEYSISMRKSQGITDERAKLHRRAGIPE